MYLILQGTRFQVQVLKPCKSIQKTSEEGLFIKARQILDSSWQITIYQGLMSFDSSRQILSIKVSTAISIENYKNQFFRSNFRPMLMYLCKVSFFTTLDIYKACFKSRHIREYQENTCKRWLMPYSHWKKLLRLCTLGFCNQVFLDLHCWWSEELCNQHLLQVGELVTYWEPCIIG